MTTSPPASNTVQPVNGEVNSQPDSIGWLFIEKYYELYTKNINNLYVLYDKNASISHDKFPASEKSSSRVLYKAKGTDAIKDHFKADSNDAKKNRVVITSANFQFSVDKSILIVVFGEWSKGDSQYWPFSQTFLLTSRKETVYDVVNDILKFVDFEEYKPQVTVVKQQESTPVSNTPTENEESIPVTSDVTTTEVTEPAPLSKYEVSEEPKSESDTSAVENQAKTKVVASDPIKENKAESSKAKETLESAKTPEVVETSTVKEDVKAVESKPVKPSSEKVTESKKSEESKKSDSKPEKESKQRNSNQPLSWADLAAKEPPKSAAKIATVASPGAAKVAPAPSPIVKKASPPSVPVPTIQNPPQAQANGKYKKEDWYPIYIRNVEIDPEVLRQALIKEFGAIKFFKKNVKIALCDFENKEHQEAALKQKQMKIGENTVYLEPREPRDSRDSKSFSGKADFKRSRSDKKQNAKKNGSASKN